MTDLSPFQPLVPPAPDSRLAPLAPALTAVYGPLPLPCGAQTPIIITNFVASLDGVVSLMIPGKAGGGDISGFNRHDRLLMAIVRTVADAVVVGAQTLITGPRAQLTPQYLAPTYADAFAETRAALGLAPSPLAVVVTGSGNLKTPHPILCGDTPALVVTTPRGRAALPPLPEAVRVVVVPGEGRIAPTAIVAAIQSVASVSTILIEGGPGIVSDFLAARLLDELFLTIAPQVVGRAAGADRPGFVFGHLFAPDDPRWATVRTVHRAGDHLFIRYAFARPAG